MKIGIVGAGSIVKELLGIRNKLCGIEFTALHTRRYDVGRKFCSEYGIPTCFEHYEELLDSKEIDFIYIAIPNNLHFEFAKKALTAGKNVILEKPFACRCSDVCSLITLAREKNLYIFEAISCIHTPTLGEMKNSLKDIGSIKHAAIPFMQYSRRYDDFKKGIIHPVFNREMCGGALFDLGIYSVYAAIYLFGVPERAIYSPVIEKTVDVSGKITLEYADFVCECDISKTFAGDNRLVIDGENGKITSQSKPNEISKVYLQIGENERIITSLAGSERLTYEWLAFKDIYSCSDSDRYDALCNCAENVAKVMEALYSFVSEKNR